jgi:hypothetical protein
MTKYLLVAAGLKAFSCSPFTRRAYRKLGNTLGGKKRAQGRMPAYYLGRVKRMLRLAKVYGVPKDGDRLLEVGTGWLHWEAITTRLFFKVEGVLFDVWDNRQIAGLKNYLRQLGSMLDQLEVDETQRTTARSLIAQIEQAGEYRDLYEALGFRYVVEPDGRVDQFENDSFDFIVSAAVLEHVLAADAPSLVQGMGRVLKPGGYSFHSINIRDHLHLYDKSASPKQYLRYPEWVWKTFFENKVQYINRIQRPDWLALFAQAGLDLVEEQTEPEELSGTKVAKPYRHYQASDLSCGGLTVLHRKLGVGAATPPGAARPGFQINN